MISILSIVLAIADFLFASINLYHGLNSDFSLSFAVSLFCFGMGILQTAVYLKDDVK